MRFVFGIVALLLTPPGLPSGGFHWQRTITPPAGAGLSQACFTLDAQTFANAAPALRDLRLFQDGAELPYAVEESYDSRALESGTTPDDDRSLYEMSAQGDLGLTPTVGVVSGHMLPNPKGYGGWLNLPAHVPVERLRLDRPLSHAAVVDLQATELGGNGQTSENIRLVLQAGHTALPVTLGVNLQHAAQVAVAVEEEGTPVHSVVLEMRRRSLCYQPRSVSPLTLYLGGGEAMTAKTYSYASNFSTAVDRPYATVGPLVPNPDLESSSARTGLLTQRKRLWLAAALAIAFFGIAVRSLSRSTKSPA